MDRSLIRTFWGCGDGGIIDFAIMRARLNKMEKEVLHLVYDECLTQEAAAEQLNISPRCLQKYYYSATEKLYKIPWVLAYAREIRLKRNF